MKRILLLLFVLILPLFFLNAQTPADSSYLITLNQQIDNYVVQRDSAALEKIYASDFVFSHGSGRVDSKQSWLSSVTKGGFLLRQHDSVTVELHPALAILRGKLSVQKKNKDKTDRYWLKYVRVYAYREKQWWFVSHVTTYEYHEQ
jgi:hypothetical protein